MTVSPRVWFVTFVGLVLLIGVSAGVLIDRTWLGPPRPGGRRQIGGPLGPAGPGGPPPAQLVDELDRQLQLTAEQRQQILAILQAHRPRVRDLQNEARDRFNAEQKALMAEISAVLTDEQAARLREILIRSRQPAPGRRGGGPPGGE
jgi:Spy/CpxP family protein refolding chaperone